MRRWTRAFISPRSSTVATAAASAAASARGIASATLAFDPRDIAEAPDTLPNGEPRPAPTERSDNPALVFSAAQQDQTAKEMPPADKTAEPHGAFTAALIQALQALPANAPASLVYQRVKAVLEGGSVPDQEPDLDATAARRQQPLFGGKAADSGKIRTAALQTDDSGSVWLDIGRVSGVGVGSEFTATSPDSKGQTVKLRGCRAGGHRALDCKRRQSRRRQGSARRRLRADEMDSGGAGAAAHLALAFQSVDAGRRCRGGGSLFFGSHSRLRSGRGAVDARSLLGRQELDAAKSRRARS